MINKKNIPMILLMGITAVFITATLFIFAKTPMDVISACPLYISLFVMSMQSRANRYAFILGAINSVFYAVIYFWLGLYAMGAYAITVSFPLQLITFYNWNKKPYGSSTVFKRLGLKKSLIIAVLLAVAWGVCYIILSFFNSNYLILDNTITMFGVLTTVICSMSYIEYIFLNIASSFVSFVLYFNILMVNPAQSTYFIYNIYALICLILSAVRIVKLYKKQNESF